MSGLRERKKAATTRRILEEASRSFQEKGYENTRIEDVAEAADLSVATFYNYFRSKADILLSGIAAETEIVLAEAEKCIIRPHNSAAEAFDALVVVYFTTSFSSTPRSLWRIAVSQTMLRPKSEFCQRYLEMDNRLSLQSCRFVRIMQEAGHIHPVIDAKPVGEMLFNNVNMNFLEFIRDDRLTAQDVCAAVSRQCAPVFYLLSDKVDFRGTSAARDLQTLSTSSAT